MLHVLHWNHRGSGARRLSASAVAALAFAVAATSCSGATRAPTQPGDDELPLLEAGSVLRVPLEPGLEQTLELKPQRLHPGDRLHIRSVVRNVSNEYKKAEALVCQLEIRTDMNFVDDRPLILCFAYSITVRLAPKDSLVLETSGTVKSRPGVYVMAVRHLLRPDLLARVRVRVQPFPEATSRAAG